MPPVADEVVCRAQRDAQEHVDERVRPVRVSVQDISGGNDHDAEGAVEAVHGCDEEDRPVDGVDLWILESLDLIGAGPADLLEEPA